VQTNLDRKAGRIIFVLRVARHRANDDAAVRFPAHRPVDDDRTLIGRHHDLAQVYRGFLAAEVACARLAQRSGGGDGVAGHALRAAVDVDAEALRHVPTKQREP
jgi:hypothetical protein